MSLETNKEVKDMNQIPWQLDEDEDTAEKWCGYHRW
jgi:hypothetical protein